MTKDFGTKSMPVYDESAASRAIGAVIDCGGKASTLAIGTSYFRMFARLAGGAEARRVAGVEDTEIVRRSADRVEHRLARGEEAVAVGPAVIDRRASGVLVVDRQHFRRAVRRPRAALVGAVLADQELARQRMIVGAKRIA